MNKRLCAAKAQVEKLLQGNLFFTEDPAYVRTTVLILLQEMEGLEGLDQPKDRDSKRMDWLDFVWRGNDSNIPREFCQNWRGAIDASIARAEKMTADRKEEE